SSSCTSTSSRRENVTAMRSSSPSATAGSSRLRSSSEGPCGRADAAQVAGLPSWKLLDGPAVAVGVLEEHERTPREVLDLADIDAALDELGTRRTDVGNNHLESLNDARPHVREPRPDGDRARRPWRGQLHEAKLVADRDVVVSVEAGLVG